MNTRTLSRPLRLRRAPWRSLVDGWLEAAHRGFSRWLERRAEREEADIAMAVERELRHLDARTLTDIGAPQGLIGQRRWQSEQDDWRRELMLRSPGW